MEYTFTLREAYWHDGTRVTPDDVIFTVAAMKSSPIRKADVDFIHETRKVGDAKVKFILKEPVRNPLGCMAFKIIPKHIAREVPITIDNPIARNPIGSGPYKFREKGTNGAILLVKNERYFDTESLPQIDEIEMIPFSTEEDLFDGFLRGYIDIIVSLPPKYVYIVQDYSRIISVTPYRSLSYQYFALNMLPERDTIGTRFLRGDANREAGIKVRQALNYGTNRQGWLDSIIYDCGELTSGPFLPGSTCYNNDVPVYEYNMEKANRLLDEAGFSDRDENGFRKDKDGETIVLTLIEKHRAEVYRDICLAFEYDMQKLGIKVKTEYVDSEEWYKRVYYDHNFDVTINLYQLSNPSCSFCNIYHLFLSSQNYPGGNNYVSYSNEHIDLLLEKAHRTLDPEQFLYISRYLHELISKECPYIFLWTPIQYAARKVKIKGFRIHPFAFFTFITEWYVED